MPPSMMLLGSKNTWMAKAAKKAPIANPKYSKMNVNVVFECACGNSVFCFHVFPKIVCPTYIILSRMGDVKDKCDKKLCEDKLFASYSASIPSITLRNLFRKALAKKWSY